MTQKKKRTVLAKSIRRSTGLGFVLSHQIAKTAQRQGVAMLIHHFPAVCSAVDQRAPQDDPGDVSYDVVVTGPEGTHTLGW